MTMMPTRRDTLSGALLAGAVVNSQASAATIDLAHFGVSPGAKDNSAALQAAFDSADRGFPAFFLSQGLYRVSRPLHIRHPLALAGSGAYDVNAALPGCAIVASGVAGPLLTVEPANTERLRGFTLSGLLFDCGGGSGLSFRRCADFALSRVAVRDAKGFGLEFRNSWDATIVDAFVSRCGLTEPVTGAVEISGEAFADNCNSLHFLGARVESSHGPNLVILAPPLHCGPNNNIQFVASKFHLPAGNGSTPAAANLILNPAEAISFHGTQIFDSGSGFPVIDFAGSRSIDTSYAFFGCDIDVRAGDALFGGDMGAGHRFFGCSLRSDPAAPHPKPLYKGQGNLLQRVKDRNSVYRLTS